MKVALISDIHAKLPAFDAVLNHARQQDVEVIWNLGDFIGYGAEPDQVVRRFRKENVLSIVGNFDTWILKFPKKSAQW